MGGPNQASTSTQTSASGLTSTVVPVGGAKSMDVGGVAWAFLGVVGFVVRLL